MTRMMFATMATVAVTAGGLATAQPAAEAAVGDLPPHYSMRGAHLWPGATNPVTRAWGWGPWYAGTVVYVVGDSMAGQVADPIHEAEPNVRTKPRTKSSTAFQLPATGSSERAQYSRAVLEQMETDARAGKRVIAVLSTQKGTSVDRRRTVWHLRNRGIAPRIVTSAPFPESGTRPGENFRLQSDGIGRWAALKAARETNTPVLDLRGIVARPIGHSGLYRGTSHGYPIYRTGSHVTVDWASRVLPWHVRSKLKI